jgi:DNA-binding transcriptional ArsR family regulator
MQHVDAARLARCLKAVCDPNRIQILSILVEGEYCVSDLVERLRIDQPKVSHHLAILRDAGIIRSRREGRHINYSIWPNVHRRQPSADGPVDVFELGDLSVSFRFATGPAAETGAPGAAARPPIAAPGQRPGQREAGTGHFETSAGAGAGG